MPFARAADDDDASDTSSLVSTVIGEHMPLISRDELFGGAWSGHESAAHGELERRARPGPKRTRRVVSLLAFMIAATAAAAIVVLLAGRAPAAAGARRGSLDRRGRPRPAATSRPTPRGPRSAPRPSARTTTRPMACRSPTTSRPTTRAPRSTTRPSATDDDAAAAHLETGYDDAPIGADDGAQNRLRGSACSRRKYAPASLPA